MIKYGTLEIIEIASIIQKGELDRSKGELDCSEFDTKTVLKFGLQRLAAAKALKNANYQKIRHGQWVENDNGGWFCSECNGWLDDYYGAQPENYPYCWRCGAKLDGVKEAP